MQHEVFKAGVEPGSPTTDYEVKMLLCYVLNEMQDPISFSQMNEALQAGGFVNYFQLVEALGELAEKKHVLVTQNAQGEDSYAITPSGKEMALTFTGNIPYSVRAKAVRECANALKRKKRKTEVIFRTEKVENGYNAIMSIPDGDTEFIRLSLFLTNEKQCNMVKKHFLNDPGFIYQEIVSLLMGETHSVGKQDPSQEKLFE